MHRSPLGPVCRTSREIPLPSLPFLRPKLPALMLGFFSFRYRPVPEMVPPVPTPATRMSILPSVWFQISGPVVLWEDEREVGRKRGDKGAATAAMCPSSPVVRASREQVP